MLASLTETILLKKPSRRLNIEVKSPTDEFVQLIDGASSPPALQHAVQNAFEGLKKNCSPVLCEEGVGGTYFIHDDKKQVIAVFKPQDEEACSVNNPKGFRKNSNSMGGYKEGFSVGDGSIRECAAYLLDYDNFSGVPATDLVVIQHPVFYHSGDDEELDTIFQLDPPFPESPTKPKVGSFQQFIKNDGNTDDADPRLVSSFPVDEVHKVAVLDIRLVNADRHGGNILYQESINDLTGESYYTLIPIDHGYCLPNGIKEAWFCWQTWPQAKLPMSQRTKEYINTLDAEKDISLLLDRFGDVFSEEHFKVLRISTMLLKKAVASNLTFFQIANILCRSDINEPSELEKLVSEAQKLQHKVQKPFLKILSDLLDEYLKKFKRN